MAPTIEDTYEIAAVECPLIGAYADTRNDEYWALSGTATNGPLGDCLLLCVET